MENFNHLVKELTDKIKVEMSLLDRLLEAYSELLDRSQRHNPI